MLRIAFSLLLLCACDVSARAQEGSDFEAQDAAEIRQLTENVLEAAEFERLRNLLESDLIPEKDEDDADRSRDRETRDTAGKSWDFHFGDWGIGAALGQIVVGLAWICVAAVVVLMVYLVAKAIKAAREKTTPDADGAPAMLQGEPEPEHAPGELPADVYIEAARRLAAEGRFREAVAQLLLGAMSHIERAGWIRFRRGLTHRDYLRAIRTHDHVHAALRDIVKTYEPLGFGRRTATGEHYVQSLQRYEVGFRAIPQATSN